MTYATYDSINVSEGPQTLLTYSASVVPILPGLILFGFFMVIFLGSFFYQRRSLGLGNLAGSFAVAGFLTFLAALGFSMITGFINIVTLSMTIAVVILGFIWLVFSDRN